MDIQDTGKFRTNSKDQFYTSKDVANTCVQIILEKLPHLSTYTWVEPSAGSGSFIRALPPSHKILAMDIEPRCDGIETRDFLEWKPTVTDNVVVFGNPPFGKQSSLAKAFIRKSCEFADVIAFILPKSFTKPSMNNAFDDTFHLVHTHETTDNAFEVNGKPYNVPCVFQIWEKRKYKRRKTKDVKSVGFKYVKPNEPHDFTFRRVGVYAGRCYKEDGSPQSHHFLKLDDDVKPHIDTLMTKINKHKFPTNTVGPRSLTKTEINTVLNKIIKALIHKT